MVGKDELSSKHYPKSYSYLGYNANHYGEVVELVDTYAQGAYAERRVGSTPTFPTTMAF